MTTFYDWNKRHEQRRKQSDPPPTHNDDTSAYDRLLDRLDGVRRIGNKAQAKCPAHEDRAPSLSVTRVEGRVLVHCHAGCHIDDVLAALGLAKRDLFDDQRGAVYVYPDGAKVRRRYDADGHKRFSQSGHDTNGARTTLYRAVEVAAAVQAGEPVYMVEGEDDVHAVESLGAVATSARQGAKSLHKADLTPLYGASVVAVVDKDEAGRRWAEQLADMVDGKAKSLKFLQAKTGKDAAEHVAADHTLDELEEYTPPPPDPDPPEQDPGDEHDVAIDRRYLELRGQLLDLNGLRNLPPPTPLVDGYLFRDSLAWLGGKPGHAKTFASVELACCVGTGTPWHGHAVKQGRVLYLIAEGASGISLRADAWELANGRSTENVLFLPIPIQMMQTIDVAAFARLLEGLRPDLVILDTQARVTVGAEENSSRDMGRFVDGLEHLRRQSGACVLVVHHEPRNGENLRGSTALEGAATSILRVAKDGDLVTLSNPKQKDAPEQPAMLLALVPTGESAVLDSQNEVGIASHTTKSEDHLLTLLGEIYGNREVAKTELRAAAELADSTFYRSINSLVSKGLVRERQHGNSTLYSVQQDRLPS